MLKLLYKLNGLYYRIDERMEKIAEALLPKDVSCATPLFYRHDINGEGIIEGGRVYITRASFSVHAEDIEKIALFSPYTFEKKPTMGKNIEKKEELWYITFDNLRLPFSIDGKFSAVQYYADEGSEEYGAVIGEKSVFFFENGILDKDSSQITCDMKTKISEITWSEELYERLKSQPDENTELNTRRIFFVDPKGSIAANEQLISVVINCLTRGEIVEKYLDDLLARKNPVITTTFMGEDEPGSCTFSQKTCDIAVTAIRFADNISFEKICKRIDFKSDWCYTKKLFRISADSLTDAIETGDYAKAERLSKIIRMLAE